MDRQRLLRLPVGLASAVLLVAAAVSPSAAGEPGNFSYAHGWRVGQHPRELADVNGDGHADAMGFGGAGALVGCGLDDGTSSPATLRASSFGRDQGWRVDRHERELADLNADGRADVVGFGERRPVVVTLLIHAVPPEIFENDPATGGRGDRGQPSRARRVAASLAFRIASTSSFLVM